MKVKDVMSRDVAAVTPETSLKQVAALLAARRISGVPVVDADGAVLGIVSEADILLKEQGPEHHRNALVSWLLEGGYADREKLEAKTAGEAMTAPAITVDGEKELYWVARVMSEHGVKRLPVVGKSGRLEGIVTRSDLVQAFARPDDAIALEIEEVARATLWIVDESLKIDVRDGEVTLSGTLERRTDADLLTRFAGRVPGVVAVHSSLEWRWDDRHVAAPGGGPRVPAPPR